jgi:small-conductance mechanosensitive channel
MERLNEFNKIVKFPLFNFGKSTITASDVIVFTLVILLSVVVSVLFRRLLRKRIFERMQLSPGVVNAYERIIHYVIVVIGIFTAFNAVGVQLSVLFAGGAALLVGIGFGIQNIVNNFISGIILLFERPIKVGDYIEVDGILGTVQAISGRSSQVISNDQIVVIVPNSKFLQENVVNWSYADITRLNIMIRVAFDTDLEKTKSILLQIAAAHSEILSAPAPDVFCDKYGESGIELTLLAFIKEPHKHRKITSDVNFAINKAFALNGIVIPFPQRDIYVKNLPTKNN